MESTTKAIPLTSGRMLLSPRSEEKETEFVVVNFADFIKTHRELVRTQEALLNMINIEDREEHLGRTLESRILQWKILCLALGFTCGVLLYNFFFH